MGDGDAKDGDAKDGDAKDGEAKDGEAKDGEDKDAEDKDGEAKDGDAKDGEAKDGDAKDGEAKKDKEVFKMTVALKLNVEFSEALGDSNSDEFKNLAADVEGMLNTEEVKALGMKAVVTAFRNGAERRRRSLRSAGVEAVVEYSGPKSEDMNPQAFSKKVVDVAKAAAAEASIISEEIIVVKEVSVTVVTEDGGETPEGGEGRPVNPERPVKPVDENASSKYFRGPSPMSFPKAKQWCKKEGKVLPRSENSAENAEMAKFGATWLDVLVNQIFDNDGVYDNFKRRQRAYLQDDGRWAVLDASEKREFYCVSEKEQLSCDDGFRDVFDQSLSSQWSVKHIADIRYSALNEVPRLERGSKLRYVCPNSRSGYAFICVRIKNQGTALVKCKNKNCTSFTRRPYKFNENSLRCVF